MKTQHQVNFPKYTQIKNKLDESETDSQNDDISITAIMADLIPIYYHYRKQLIGILNTSGASYKNVKQLTKDPQQVQAKLKQCLQIVEGNGATLSKYVSRNLITEKVIERKRKAIKEQKDLREKYESHEGMAFLENPVIKSARRSEEKDEIREKDIKTSVLRKQSSIEVNLDGTQNFIHFNSGSRIIKNQVPTLDIGSRRQTPIHRSKNKLDGSDKSTRNIQNIKASHFKNNDNDDEVSQESSKDNASSRNNIPQIRINYQNTPRDSQQEHHSPARTQFYVTGKAKSRRIFGEDETLSQYQQKVGTSQKNNMDTFSVKGKANKFFQVQNKKLLQQKYQAEKLHRQVSQVIGQCFFQQKIHFSQETDRSRYHIGVQDEVEKNHQVHQNYLLALKHIFCELCDLNGHSQNLKYLLRNKQYEILKVMHQGDFGKEQILAKQLRNNIQYLLNNQQKSQTNIIIEYIFIGQNSINFQKFENRFKTKLSQTESLIINSNHKKKPQNVNQTLRKLFSIWLQMSYFEGKVRKMSQLIPNEVQKIRRIWFGSKDKLSIDEIEKFLFSTFQNRKNRLKIELLFDRICHTRTFSQFLNWIKFKTK